MEKIKLVILLILNENVLGDVKPGKMNIVYILWTLIAKRAIHIDRLKGSTCIDGSYKG